MSLALACAIIPSAATAARRPVIDLLQGPARAAAGTSASFAATFTADRGSSITTSWSWGDSTFSPGNVSGSSVAGAHTWSAPGTYAVTLRLSDGRSSTTAETSVVVYDPAPSAANDAYRVDSNAVLNVPAAGLLANDSDPRSQQLTATLVSTPLNGTVALNADGSFVYAPFPDYAGTDHFTYSATSGAFTSNVAAATITVGSTPEIDIDDPSTSEGSSLATFTIRLTEPASQSITIQYATTDGSATSAADYGIATGSITFEPGSTAQTITVDVVSDSLQEAAETFYVDLTGATHARLRKSRGRCTIDDDDGSSTPALSIADVRQLEGNAGVTTMPFEVTLSSPSTSVVAVDYRTIAINAVPYEDYVPVSGTVTFAPGTTRSYVQVPINGDTRYEGTEQLLVQLLTPVNATVSDSVGVGTILNDDCF